MQVDGKTTRARAASGVTKKGTPRVRAPRNCRKCGRPGARADGCGTSHEPLNKSDDEDERAGIDQPPVPIPRTAAIAERIASNRRNDRSTNDAHRPPPIRPLKALPNGRLKLDTTTVVVRAASPCPHGAGSAASCSQCVLGAKKVTRVAIVGGDVVVDGAVVRSMREHVIAAAPKHGRMKQRKNPAKDRAQTELDELAS